VACSPGNDFRFLSIASEKKEILINYHGRGGGPLGGTRQGSKVLAASAGDVPLITKFSFLLDSTRTSPRGHVYGFTEESAIRGLDLALQGGGPDIL